MPGLTCSEHIGSPPRQVLLLGCRDLADKDKNHQLYFILLQFSSIVRLGSRRSQQLRADQPGFLGTLHCFHLSNEFRVQAGLNKSANLIANLPSNLPSNQNLTKFQIIFDICTHSQSYLIIYQGFDCYKRPLGYAATILMSAGQI
jgi:hypothetical protein